MIAVSCGFPPSRDLPAYARLAESLGYRRVWAYDSPALYGDVWVALARVAEATERIGVATGVAVPSLRHPVVTASAIATIEDLAPGRLAVAFGTGFTARLAMGKRAMRWADLAAYVETVRALLRGDVAEVDGAACQLISSPGFGPARPIDVPLLVAPSGPKGFAVARDVADGVVVVGLPPKDERSPGWGTCAVLVNGTVLDPGEDETSPRVRAAAGPWFVTSYHAVHEWGPDALAAMPGGRDWLAGIEAERPEGQRHLAVHEGHVVTVTDRDRPLLDAAGAGLLGTGWTGDRAAVRSRLEHAEAEGATEVIYTPAGPDVPRELEAFASAADGG
ncbi:MAG TPA: LLM class flavin-dependent oxidoreductase [Acidimicrobiia bacterium]|nr:LLM class flavin-dependent oxidoreductase [Acidimicrobiia bacterium]